jgi:hypothetical protein
MFKKVFITQGSGGTFSSFLRFRIHSNGSRVFSPKVYQREITTKLYEEFIHNVQEEFIPKVQKREFTPKLQEEFTPLGLGGFTPKVQLRKITPKVQQRKFTPKV